MKKTLLLFLLCFGVYASMAQSQREPKIQRIPPSKLIPQQWGDNGVPTKAIPFIGLNAGHSSQATSRSVNKTLIGSSGNLFSVLVENQQIVSGNQDLGIIQMIHRLNNSELVAGGNIGSIESSFSMDGGLTWDSTLSLYVGDDPYKSGRYPQGGVFNPAGNTDPTQAFAVAAGPIVGADWFANYFASTRYDGTDNAKTVFDNTISPVLENMPRVDFWVGGNNCYAIGSHQLVSATAGGSGPFYGAVLNVGQYNLATNAFDWGQTILDDAWVTDSAGNTNVFQQPNEAWSLDGQTGYIVFLGTDSAYLQSSFVPIVYQSTDAGKTWVKMANFDFGSIQSFKDNLITNWDGNVRPWYYPFDNGSDMAVDKNNNLHILCQVVSGAGSTPDSAGFTWTDYKQDFYDTYMTSDGNWDAKWIDSIKTYAPGDPMPDGSTAGTPYSDGTGFDARVQMATNADRDKFFMVWMDSDPNNTLANVAPDVWGIDWDLEGRKSIERNFTAGSNYEQNNYWLCVSNLAINDGLGNYSVPATTSIDAASLFDSAIPTYHSFLSGLDFPASDFVGIADVPKHSFNVTPISPNPVAGTSMFTVTLDKSSKVTVQVTNVLGETMMVKSYNFSSGSHQVNLSKDHLPSGVYFYTVNVGNDKITNKMVVD